MRSRRTWCRNVGKAGHGLHAFARDRGHPRAHAPPSSRSTCSRSKPIRRTTTTTRISASTCCAPCRRRRAPRACGRRRRPRNTAAGSADRRLGGDVRGGQPLDLRPARVQLRGARRRQHELARARRHPGAEGQVAGADRRRRGALVVRDDRAVARRRLRSRHDPHPRREDRRRLGDPRPQVVHHRRRHRRSFHSRGAHLRRPAPRAHRLPLSPRPARLAHRAAHPDHGAGGARRPLRARVRRPRGRRRGRADGSRRRAARHPDQARAGAAHPLHALARPRQALHGDRAGLRRRSARASASSSPTARACR